MRFFSVLKQGHLAVLWSSQLLSALGDQLYLTAVVWMAIQIGGSSGGTVLVAGTISRFIFGLLGGVFADRYHRRRLMLIADFGRALTVATIPVALLFADLSLLHLAFVAFVLGMLDALFNPALQASLAILIDDKDSLQAMNGLLDITRRLARAVGPALFAVLIDQMPISTFFAVDTVSFLISGVAILSLSSSFQWQPQQQSHHARGLRGIITEITSAIQIVRGHTTLWWGLITFGIGMMLWSMAFTVGIPLLIQQQMGNDASIFGYIAGAYGLGSVISNVILGSIRIHRRTAVMFAGWLVLGLGFVIIAIAPNPFVAIIGAIIAAFGGPMNDIMLLVLIQGDMPENQIGKVFSLYMLLASVGTSAGLMLATVYYQLVSGSVGILLCALAMIVIWFGAWLRFGIAPDAKAKHRL